jgi:hypothetical protein
MGAASAQVVILVSTANIRPARQTSNDRLHKEKIQSLSRLRGLALLPRFPRPFFGPEGGGLTKAKSH